MATPNDWLYKSAAIMRQYRNGELKNQLGDTVINRGEAITIALAEQKRTNGDRAKEAARTENADALDKVAQVMHDFKAGKLKSSSGDKVKDRKQAIAIALSEQQRMKKRKKKVDGQELLESATGRSDDGWLVYFGGRRTPVAVSASDRNEAISKARKLKRRGGENVVSARLANESERKTAASGGWVRSGPNGEAPGKSKLRGHGPKPKNVG
jgi:hypothetical protein